MGLLLWGHHTVYCCLRHPSYVFMCVESSKLDIKTLLDSKQIGGLEKGRIIEIKSKRRKSDLTRQQTRCKDVINYGCSDRKPTRWHGYRVAWLPCGMITGVSFTDCRILINSKDGFNLRVTRSCAILHGQMDGDGLHNYSVHDLFTHIIEVQNFNVLYYVCLLSIT